MNGWSTHDTTLNPSNVYQDPSSSNALLDAQAGYASNGVNYQTPSMLHHSPATTQNLQPQQQRGNNSQYSYQVNPVIPSKRPRPSEDAAQSSPRQAPMNPNLSRSQTPQQAAFQQSFQGPHQAGAGPHMQPQAQYQHLQHSSSANATPSPTMQNQQYRPSQPPRMQTDSPNSSFTPQPQSLGMSPPPPDSNTRGGTPQAQQYNMPAHMASQAGSQVGGQPAAMGFMPGAQQFNPNYGANPNLPPNAMAGAYPQQPSSVNLPPNLAQQLAQTQRLHQMKQHQQTQQQLREQMMMNNPNGQRQPMAASPQQGMQGGSQQPPMGTPTRAPSLTVQAQQQQQMIQNQGFVRKVQSYMQTLNRPFNLSPAISGRPILLLQLFSIVSKAQGSRKMSVENQWGQVARSLGFPEEQHPSAGAEIKNVFEQCLGPYEAAFWAQQAQPQKSMMDNKQSPNNVGPPATAVPDQQHSPVLEMSQMPQPSTNQPPLQMPPQMQPRTHDPLSSPAQGVPAGRPNSNPPTQNNGWPPQSNDGMKHQQHSQQGKMPNTPQIGTPMHAMQPGYPQPSPTLPGHGLMAPRPHMNGAVPVHQMENSIVMNYIPNITNLPDSWGPILVTHPDPCERMAHLVPNVPEVQEMGLIDLRALSLCIQSAIHGEVRYALDILVKLSLNPPELEAAEDLLEVLVDCALSQFETLDHDGLQHSPHSELMSFSEVSRNVRAEIISLQEIAEVGTLEYELDRAADRLLAVTTILRNLSFHEKNVTILASRPVIDMLSRAVRLLSTRTKLLRTHINMQEFMKDIVTLLSNTADKISFSSATETSHILNFLLAFAPTRDLSQSNVLRIPLYNPLAHRYYPLAIDSIAKLLVQDEPNRNYFRQLAHVRHAGSGNLPIHQQYDLLTRTFAMAVAVVPDRRQSRLALEGSLDEALVKIATLRQSSLSQGMLTADIVASLIPPHQPQLAAGWINAEDGWAPSLLRLMCSLLASRPPDHVGPNGAIVAARRAPAEEQTFISIGHRAISMLRKLEDRALEVVGGSHKKRGTTNGTARDGDESKLQHPEVDSNMMDDDFAPLQIAGPATEADSDSHNTDTYVDEDYERSKFWASIAGEALPSSEMVLGSMVVPMVTHDILKDLQAMLQLSYGI